MKRQIIILFILFISVFCSKPSYSAVTTIDGAITLDFYEDTQSGIENRWIFDIKLNDIGGGVESIYFDIEIQNTGLNYLNTYTEQLYTDPDVFSMVTTSFIPGDPFPFTIPALNSLFERPVGVNYIFYSIPADSEGNPMINNFYDTIPIMGNFDIKLDYINNLGINRTEQFNFSGPIAFSVPEPACLSLFAFGAFYLKTKII